MLKNRLIKFALIMASLMLASQYFLAGRANILMMPFVLVVYAMMIVALHTRNDPVFNIMIAYGMSHFHFATKAGMLGPWLILTYLLLRGIGFLKAQPRIRNAPLISQIVLFVILNLVGLIYLNPNTLFENVSSFINLLGMMVVLLAISNMEITREDFRFIFYVFGIMVTYTFLSSLNTTLGIFYTTSPLLTLNEIYFNTNMAVAMFGRSYGEYFLCMNILFLNFVIVDTDTILCIKKSHVIIFYIVSFLGCLLGYSKTMTTLLIIGNLVVILGTRVVKNIRSITSIFVAIAVLLLMVVIMQQFVDLSFIIERFREQPEIFKNVYESPLTAEGTSRSDSFYWGWRRNMQQNWIIGYGWSPADANHAAYFEGLSINIGKQDFHNLYLSIFPIFGWIGGGVFLFWLAKFVLVSFRMSRRKDNPYVRSVGAAFLGLSLVFLLGEYAVPVTSEANYFFILMVWVGLVYGLHKTYLYRGIVKEIN